MQKQFYRYSDLVALGIVMNRVTLSRWIRFHGFPRGRLVGPNTRIYERESVDAWLASRPAQKATAVRPEAV